MKTLMKDQAGNMLPWNRDRWDAVHADDTTDELALSHTLNQDEIAWFRAGSALNYVGGQKK